jgi:thiamine-monophosphate kinase
MVNASDLAAVGADGLGILLDVTLPADAEDALIAGLTRGVDAASRAVDLPVLGGDTNLGATLSVGGTAVGTVSGGAPLTRCGCRAGERVFASGALGVGGAYALARLGPAGGETRPEIAFRPVARMREGRVLRGFATSCMDTSDGPIATLDELMRRNGVGFELTTELGSLLHPAARAAAAEARIPEWMMLAGPHGEFELVFTVPDDRLTAFRAAAESIGWTPLEMGRATAAPRLVLREHDGERTIDSARVRNAFLEVGGEVERFVEVLSKAIDGRSWR